MDGLFFACLLGLCGFPAPPLRLDPAASMTLSDNAASSATTGPQAAQAQAQPVSTRGLPSPLPERPVPRPTEGSQGPTEPQDRQEHGQPAADVAGPAKLTKGAIDEVVRRNARSIAHCYGFALIENPRYAGTIEIGWQIQVDGRVSRVKVVGSTEANHAAEDCLLAEIPRWEFPSTAEPIVVGTYPFVFNGGLLARRSTR